MLLRLAPALTLALLLAPVGGGLLFVVLPAFGVLPALGGTSLSFAPWRALFSQPGFPESLRLTVTTALAATLLSALAALGTLALLHGTRALARIERALAPFLAVPHAALAIALAFLLAPSGWIARLVSPWLTGWTRPPDLALPQDPDGIVLVLALMAKEVPYLLLMGFAALRQVPAAALMRSAMALGQTRPDAFAKVVLPAIWPQLRLPLAAVWAFSLSAADIAVVLAPSDPPPLVVLVLRLAAGRDPAALFPAAAGALLLAALAALGMLAWMVLERAVAAAGRRWIVGGGRGAAFPAVAGLVLGGIAALLAALAMLGLPLWAVAQSWRFPEALPSAFTLATLSAQAEGLAAAAATTLAIAAVATGTALVLAALCLEAERRRHLRPGARALAALYAPLLVPQLAFLLGLQVALVWLDLDGSFVAVAWAHLVFVLPYVFLSLADPWRALDTRFARTAAALGLGPWRVMLRVVLPLLARPLATAAAVGVAVSVALYLPTLFAGAGRITTLATEAVALSSGGDRRVIAAWALLQAAIPLLAYAAALRR